MKPFKPICLAFLLLSWLPAGAQVVIDPSAVVGAIKPMNAVNNGPAVANAKEQTRGNFYEYKVLNIPYARTHDSAYYAGYGGPHCVDISQLFPDFDKSPNDPSAYDFTNTDAYLTNITAAGTQVFFRQPDLDSLQDAFADLGQLLLQKDEAWPAALRRLRYHLEMVDRMAMRRNEWRDWMGLEYDPEMEELLALENYIPANRLGDQSKLTGGET